MATLIKFCAEGESIGECVDFVSFLENYIHIFEKTNKDQKISLIFPPSWKSLFSTPSFDDPSSIF